MYFPDEDKKDKSGIVSVILLICIIVPLIAAVVIYALKSHKSANNFKPSTQKNSEETVRWVSEDTAIEKILDELNDASSFVVKQKDDNELLAYTDKLQNISITAENTNGTENVFIKLDIKTLIKYSTYEGYDPVAVHLESLGINSIEVQDEIYELIAKSVYAVNGSNITYSDEQHIREMIKSAENGLTDEFTLKCDNTNPVNIGVVITDDFMCIIIETKC